MVRGSTSQWYLIALHGDMVMRVRPGMPLGETATGELSFDPSCAQIELDIADDGGLMLSAVDDHQLEFGGGTRCRRERLARDRRPEIRLPHNVLRLVTDFSDPAQANETVEVRAVRPTEDIAESQIGRFLDEPPGSPADVMVAERPPRRGTLRFIRRGVTSMADTPWLKQMLGLRRLLRVPLRPGPDVQTVGDGSAARRTERTGARRQRILSPQMAVLIGLGGLGFALLYSVYPALRDAGVQGPSATTIGAGPAPQTAPAQAPSANAESNGPDTDARLSVVPFPSNSLLLPALDASPATGPESHEEVAERPTEQLPEPGPVAAPAIQPVALPRVKPPSIPKVAKTAPSIPKVAKTAPSIPKVAKTARADETVAAPETIRSQPYATAAAGPEENSATTRAQTVEMAPVLFAADQALAQGRLTTPPEANAYTLYNRVLALDPGSAAARSGLQSVRQGLINRALAQLAGGALEDARMSLQAASDAGADPSLLTHLRDEVNYRQQLINARVGQE